MKPRPASPSPAADLRLQAERRLAGKKGRDSAVAAADTHRLLHELQVHRIELELQNEELRQAKAESESALEKYTDLYDFAPVGYFTLGADGAIRLLNLTGAGLVGMERSSLVGRSFVQLIELGSRVAFAAFLKKVFADQAAHSEDFEIGGHHRPRRIVTLQGRCLSQELGCRVMMTDITLRLQAEDKVRVSEIRYRRLFEAAHDGVVLLDPATGRITDANPFMTRLLGHPREQLIGKKLFEIGLLRDEAASREMFRRLTRDGHARYDNLPLESRGGRHQEVEVVANLYDENGQPVIQCNIRDITLRKQAEEILRRSQILFSSLIAQAPVGIYVVDARFQLQEINLRALPVFKGLEPLIGRDFSEIVRIWWSPKTAGRILARFRRTLKTGEPYQAPELDERRRDSGLREIYEWQIQRVTLPAGEFGVVCFFNNITARVRAEAAQRREAVLAASNAKLQAEINRHRITGRALKKSESRARELLAEAQELQEKLRDVSHQILLAQETQRKEISRELHDEISQLLLSINVHLVIFAKEAVANPKGIRETITPLRRLVEKAVKVVHRFARDLRPAMLDDLGLIPTLRAYVQDFPHRKRREIHFSGCEEAEALDNDKRTVLYRVAQEALANVDRHARATVVKVEIVNIPGGVRLEIADNGKSFAVADLPTSRRRHRLGLVGMRERVEMVGGTFDIVSTPGTGTTIRAEVPFGKGRKRR